MTTPNLAPTSSGDGVIVIDHLSKSFGSVRAVDDLSFTVRPGRVTGFLGPNGAGKTTTLRILLGLVRASAGMATIGGRTYGQVSHPMRTVGAALEAASFHPGRSALDHLRVYAPQAGVSDVRCREVIDFVGLGPVADRRVGGFSLGMRQRLGVAASLLREPRLLVLDEPANGLDPAGIRDMRALVKRLAASGLTVLLSSHNMDEVEEICDNVTIMRTGDVVYHGTIDRLREQAPQQAHRIKTSDDTAALVLGQAYPKLQIVAMDGALHARADQAVIDGYVARLVTAAQADVDTYVRALVAAGLALRGLSLTEEPLESLFFMLTETSPQSVPSAYESAGAVA